MHVKFKRDWSDGFGNFRKGQIIELAGKMDADGKVQWGARGMHYVYRDLIELVESPKMKEPKRTGKSVEVVFRQDVATHDEKFTQGIKYTLDEFRAKKYIERGLAIPAADAIQTGSDTRPRERRKATVT